MPSSVKPLSQALQLRRPTTYRRNASISAFAKSCICVGLTNLSLPRAAFLTISSQSWRREIQSSHNCGGGRGFGTISKDRKRGIGIPFVREGSFDRRSGKDWSHPAVYVFLPAAHIRHCLRALVKRRNAPFSILERFQCEPRFTVYPRHSQRDQQL